MKVYGYGDIHPRWEIKMHGLSGIQYMNMTKGQKDEHNRLLREYAEVKEERRRAREDAVINTWLKVASLVVIIIFGIIVY